VRGQRCRRCHCHRRCRRVFFGPSLLPPSKDSRPCAPAC
jgi:hypothetical protein